MILTVVSFIFMIILNTLANTLPINGVTTGQVSNNYENLFAPAGITFAIWGLIYLLLAGYTIYQLITIRNNKMGTKTELLKKVGVYFSISSIANGMWILAWHYDRIGLSMILMVIILLCLITIVKEISQYKLTLKEKFFIKLPYSVYFGWITIATIANATTLLVSLGWDGFGISEQIWTVIIILVGLVIATITMLNYKDIAYGLVIIWAYVGILIKHLSPTGFDGQYKGIIATVIVSIIVLVIGNIYILFSRKG